MHFLNNKKKFNNVILDVLADHSITQGTKQTRNMDKKKDNLKQFETIHM